MGKFLDKVEVKKVSTKTTLIAWDENERREITVMRAIGLPEDFHQIGKSSISMYYDTNDVAWGDESVYYKLTHNGEESEVFTVSQGNDNYALACATVIMEDLRMSGSLVKVYLNLHGEQKCPECYSSIKKKRIKSTCNTCDGSGTLMGYKKPIETWARMSDRTEQKVEVTGGVKASETIVSANFGNIPMLTEESIVEHLGDIYNVFMIKTIKKITSVDGKNELAYAQTVLLKKVSNPDNVKKMLGQL